MASDTSQVKKTGNGNGNGNTRESLFIHVFPEWCKGCGICVAFCPKKVLEMKDGKAIVVRPEDCVGCYLCARRCPDFAIGIAKKVIKSDEKNARDLKPAEKVAAGGEDDRK